MRSAGPGRLRAVLGKTAEADRDQCTSETGDLNAEQTGRPHPGDDGEHAGRDEGQAAERVDRLGEQAHNGLFAVRSSKRDHV